MGGALAEGLLRSGAVAATDLTIADLSADALRRFENSGASITTDNSAAAVDADTLFIVVKPWLVERVIEGLLPVISGRRLTIVVIAAGVPSADICRFLHVEDNPQFTLFLAIPNTAIAVMQSMTFLVPAVAEAADTAAMKTLFEEVGPMPRFTCAQPLSGVRDGVFAGAALIPEFVAGDAPSRGC